ncbi:MAG: thiamine phosphate synthase [Nitrospirae bacterium]|nr:thiamine phosphate synthase [Nitrospirota bacterium]
MDFCFYLITDRHATAGGKGIEYVLDRAFEAGVRGVLLREKDLPERELLDLARRVREMTRLHGVRFLVSGRVDIALAVDADGVHIGGSSLPAPAAKRLMGEDRYLAVSTHSLAEARAAQDAGADFVTFGPVYSTPSKAKYGPPVGLDALREVCRELSIPVFALGGIRPDNAADALAAGAYGVAAISAVIGAPDPALAVRNFIDTMRGYKLGRVV